MAKEALMEYMRENIDQSAMILVRLPNGQTSIAWLSPAVLALLLDEGNLDIPTTPAEALNGLLDSIITNV